VLQGVLAMPWIGVGLGTITRAAVETRETESCPVSSLNP